MSFREPRSVDSSSSSPLLTTREAGDLTGRSISSVKNAILRGQIPAERTWDGWRVRREDVVAWSARARVGPARPHRRYDDSAVLLAEFGSLTADELSKFQSIHVGNARKYLALLAIEGRAHRHDDGEWFPGPDCQQEAAAS